MRKSLSGRAGSFLLKINFKNLFGFVAARANSPLFSLLPEASWEHGADIYGTSMGKQVKHEENKGTCLYKLQNAAALGLLYC
jgi:hypothetical protein